MSTRIVLNLVLSCAMDEASGLGTRTVLEGPLGAYQLNRNGHRRVFVATGTGLAPFLPMFGLLEQRAENFHAELLFGCRTRDEDLTQRFEPMPARVTVCTSRERSAVGGFEGRVTDALAQLSFDADSTDFYVSGRRAWWPTCGPYCTGRGARFLYVEPY